ncbi:MAG: hypothetical protein ACKOSQ_05650 [Planctomycetaceae bacterium]
MRTAIALIAAVALSVAIPASAQETIIMEGDASGGAPGGCRCRDVQTPPWHGNVCGDPCGPTCPPPNMFHANPWEQLWLKHHAHEQGYCLPSHFPRMHARSTTGWWPTPRPIATPRCPRCGAHIDPGM